MKNPYLNPYIYSRISDPDKNKNKDKNKAVQRKQTNNKRPPSL